MRERIRRYAFRGVLVAMSAGAAYYLLFGGVYSVLDVEDLKKQRHEAISRIDSLIATTDSLAQRGDSLAEDPLAIEQTAREEYGLIREGEVLVRFRGGEEELSDPESVTELDE
jgi:cell division protein FtsB